MQDGVDRALGGNPEIAIQPSNQKLADLAGTPMRLLALAANDQALDLLRQLIGKADRPAGTIAERFQALVLVPIENFVGMAKEPAVPMTT